MLKMVIRHYTVFNSSFVLLCGFVMCQGDP